jgi:hypothetical protein
MNYEVLRVTKAGRKLNELNERGTYWIWFTILQK